MQDLSSSCKVFTVGYVDICLLRRCENLTIWVLEGILPGKGSLIPMWHRCTFELVWYQMSVHSGDCMLCRHLAEYVGRCENLTMGAG